MLKLDSGPFSDANMTKLIGVNRKPSLKLRTISARRASGSPDAALEMTKPPHGQREMPMLIKTQPDVDKASGVPRNPPADHGRNGAPLNRLAAAIQSRGCRRELKDILCELREDEKPAVKHPQTQASGPGISPADRSRFH